jgi:hypothetical protein
MRHFPECWQGTEGGVTESGLHTSSSGTSGKPSVAFGPPWGHIRLRRECRSSASRARPQRCSSAVDGAAVVRHPVAHLSGCHGEVEAADGMCGVRSRDC